MIRGINRLKETLDLTSKISEESYGMSQVKFYSAKYIHKLNLKNRLKVKKWNILMYIWNMK